MIERTMVRILLVLEDSSKVVRRKSLVVLGLRLASHLQLLGEKWRLRTQRPFWERVWFRS